MPDRPAPASPAGPAPDDGLVGALQSLLDRYLELANSGDAGFWDPEEEPEVIPHWARREAQGCYWPWDQAWWKPGVHRRNLVKAGALILAEIERLDRAAAPQPEEPK